MDLTHDEDDTNTNMVGIPLQLSVSAHMSWNNSALVTLHQLDATRAIDSQNLQIVPAVLQLQQAIQLVTERCQEVLHDQRLDVLCCINKDNLLLPFNVKRLRGKTLWKICIGTTNHHNYNVQLKVRKLGEEADTFFLKDKRELLSRFSQEVNQALEYRKTGNLATEVTSEVRRRDE